MFGGTLMPDDLILRRASFTRSTFNRAAGTVEAVLSGGSDVQRRDARGPFVERIAGPMTVRGGADRVPLLDSHQRGSIAHVMGHADNIRIDGGEIRATLHVADARALDLIEAGSLTGISIGFLPTADQWSEANGQRVRSITSAVLHEASLTEFPADPSATILRSDTMPEPIIENRAELNGQIRGIVRTAQRR
jgi:HK97 family phage prohead protease